MVLLDFGFNNEVPVVEYQTQTDYFIFMSFTYVFVQIIVFVISDYARHYARQKTAESIKMYEWFYIQFGVTRDILTGDVYSAV